MPITLTPLPQTGPPCCGDQSAAVSPGPTTPVACTNTTPPPVFPVNEVGQAMLDKDPVLTVKAGIEPCLEWVIRNYKGEPINLTSCLDEGVGNEDDPEAPAPTLVVKFRMREAISACSFDCCTGSGVEIVDADNGKVRVCLSDELRKPGIYRAAFGVMLRYAAFGDTPVREQVLDTNEFIVVVDNGMWGDASRFPIWSRVREQMADLANENTLTGEKRFTDGDIANAMIQCVEYWNESLPEVPDVFTTVNYPFKSHWIDGTIGRLMILNAERLRSKYLPISGGGISVNDRDKFAAYDQRGQEWWDTYKQFVHTQKMRITMRRGASAHITWAY